jgi:hypothetical protein
MNKFTLGTYRKLIYTDTVISKSFSHTNNNKQAAFNYLLDRVHKMPIFKDEKEKEMKQINTTATANGHINDINKSYEKQKRVKPISNADTSPAKTKTWTKFMYFGTDIGTLTKILKKYYKWYTTLSHM